MLDIIRYRLTIVLLLLCVVAHAQQHIQYADTFKAQSSLLQVQDDIWLLSLLREQSAQLAAEADSIEQQRIISDTTTIFPFHVGYADSLRIARQASKIAATHPLTQPLLFIPPAKRTLQQAAVQLSKHDLGSVREQARMYMNTNCADVFVGTYQPALIDEINIHEVDDGDIISLEKYLVRDHEEDKISQKRFLRDMFSPWRKEATLMLQISQNYVSKNWYAGGNTNFALLGIAQGSIKYDDKNRITWENTGEWRLGFNTVTGDTLRKVNTNEDILKLYTKFGYRLFNKVSYTLSADLETHFFNTWQTNTKTLKTGPFTPFRFNLATGLDYRPVEGLSIYLAPLTYKLVAAADTVHAEQTAYSIPTGKKVLNEAGSSVRVEWEWKPVREIDFKSTFYFYTNYKRVELDLEVTCNFIINRFVSTRVVLHPRYDNTVILADDERAKMQFKELISIGFTHKFR